MIRLKNVNKKFDSRGIAGVSGVDLEIHPGEIFAIMGPNGSGKTTLINLISGHLVLDSGSIEIDGPVHQFRSDFLDQNVQRYLIDRVTTIDDPEKKLQLARDMADLFEFTSQLRQNLSQLSAGQAQKVLLAGELINRPTLLLLDEPFAHLDPHTRQDILRSLFKMIKQQQTTILWVTHDLSEALTFSDQIGILNFGKFSQVASPVELVRRPKNLFVAQFLGFYNFMAQPDTFLVIPDDAWEISATGAEYRVGRLEFEGISRVVFLEQDEKTYKMRLKRSDNIPEIGDKIKLQPILSETFSIPL